MRGKYDDIIGLSRPVSARHAPMSMENRAAQFSPFAALTGYDDAIGEAGRLTDQFTAPDEETARLISIRLQLLQERERQRPPVEMLCFIPDGRKEGGAYKTVSGQVQQVDACEQCIRLTDGRRIPFAAVVQLESPLFPEAFPVSTE